MDTRNRQVRDSCTAEAPCDACLNRRLLERDPSAAEHVGQRYADDLRRVACKVLASTARASCSAADLVHQFLLQLLNDPQSMLSGFAADGRKLRSFLLQAAEWRMTDYAESRAVNWPKRTLEEPVDELDPRDECPSGEPLAGHDLEELKHRISTLDQASRWLLEARFGIGQFDRPLGVTEIGKRLGISAGQVSRRVKTVVEKLRRQSE